MLLSLECGLQGMMEGPPIVEFARVGLRLLYSISNGGDQLSRMSARSSDAMANALWSLDEQTRNRVYELADLITGVFVGYDLKAREDRLW